MSRDALESATRARNLLRDVSVDAGDEMDERITEALSLCCDVVDVLHGGEASTEMSDEEQKTQPENAGRYAAPKED